MTKYFSTLDVTTCFALSSWQRTLYAEFESSLLSKSRPFPCVFGVSAFKTGQLRMTFPDPLNAETLAPVLQNYLGSARSFGSMTSLVVFTRPEPVRSIANYKQQFWTLLKGLRRHDPKPWPADIPTRLDTSGWEFCFAGEPIFVVCNTPAHVLRQSRRSTSFMVTFQPRWVFEGITDSEAPAARRALANVRKRLREFDAVPVFPYLGQYGNPENREHQQYYIDDSNEKPACPFHELERDVSRIKGKVA